MSRKLAALALVLAILVCSMGLKTALSAGHASSQASRVVLIANGPAPTPDPPTRK
jgi:hypothetical protein